MDPTFKKAAGTRSSTAVLAGRVGDMPRRNPLAHGKARAARNDACRTSPEYPAENGGVRARNGPRSGARKRVHRREDHRMVPVLAVGGPHIVRSRRKQTTSRSTRTDLKPTDSSIARNLSLSARFFGYDLGWVSRIIRSTRESAPASASTSASSAPSMSHTRAYGSPAIRSAISESLNAGTVTVRFEPSPTRLICEFCPMENETD